MQGQPEDGPAAGLTQADPRTIEASLRRVPMGLEMAGAPADNVDLLMTGVRQRVHELRRAAKPRGK